MTRTTDDLHPEPWRPLGEKVTPPAPPAAAPAQVAPGVMRDPATGKLHTNLPLPKDKP